MYIIKSLNVYNLFWKTTHPEPSLPLSLSLLSWAFKYSSTAYQSSHQKQAFHKPAGIIQMKKLSAQLHRHYNKCFTGPTLGPSTWLTLTPSSSPFPYCSSSRQTVHPCLPFPQRPHFCWLLFGMYMIILKIPTSVSSPIKLASSLYYLYFSC